MLRFRRQGSEPLLVQKECSRIPHMFQDESGFSPAKTIPELHTELMQAEALQEASRLFHLLREASEKAELPLSINAYNRIINRALEAKAPEEAMRYFRLIRQDRKLPNSETYTILTGSLVREHPSLVKQVIEDFVQGGHSPLALPRYSANNSGKLKEGRRRKFGAIFMYILYSFSLHISPKNEKKIVK